MTVVIVSSPLRLRDGGVEGGLELVVAGSRTRHFTASFRCTGCAGSRTRPTY